MLKPNELATRDCVERDRNLFEKVAKGFVNAKDVYRVQYTILDYEKILDQMIEFVDGYKKYEAGGDRRYDGKVLTISRNFYDKMFTDKDYRKKINLEQFREINVAYLKKVKQLQTTLESYLKEEKVSSELNSLIRMTNNQFKKLSKVCRDDMKIYLWLTTGNSKFFAYNLDESTRAEFVNKKSPVMHKYKKGS